MDYKDKLNKLSLDFDKKMKELSEEYDILADELYDLDYTSEDGQKRHREIHNRMSEIKRQLEHGLLDEYNEALSEIIDDKIKEVDCILEKRVS